MAERRDGDATRPTLGGLIRHQRQLAQLSLRELSAATSVSNAYLSQIERGLHQPSIRILRAIADALEISSDQLLQQAGLAGSRSGTSGAGRVTAVERALADDELLDEDARRALLVLYRRLARREETPPATEGRRRRG